MNKKIGLSIKKLREVYNLSQTEFANKFGISHATVSYIEAGKVPVKVTTLKRFADEFNISADWFLDNTKVTGYSKVDYEKNGQAK